jgi:hypothetical protein
MDYKSRRRLCSACAVSIYVQARLGFAKQETEGRAQAQAQARLCRRREGEVTASGVGDD